MAVFETLLGNLRHLGFFDFLLPWLLALAVMYGLLNKSKIVSEEYSVNALIAIVVAFFLVNYTPYGFLGEFFTHIFASAVILLSAILVGVMFLSMTGMDAGEFMKENKIIVGLLAFIAVIAIFVAAGGSSIFGYIDINSDWFAIIFMFLIMAMALGFLGKKD